MYHPLRILRRALLVTAASLLILLALLTGLARLLLPFAEDFRAELQDWVSTELALPVRIGQLDVSWVGFAPRARLVDVALRSATAPADSSDDQWQRIGDIHAHFDLLALLRGERLPVSDLAVVGVRLKLLRELDGRWRVAGLPLREDTPADWLAERAERAQRALQKGAPQGSALPEGVPSTEPAPAADGDQDWLGWLLNASALALEQAEIEIYDARRQLGYTLRDVNLRIANEGNRHRLAADLALPLGLGERVSLLIDARGQPGAYADWHGSLYLRADALSLARLDELSPQQLPLHIEGGQLDLRAWSQWRGDRLQDLQLTTQLRGLHLAALGEPRGDASHQQTQDQRQGPAAEALPPTAAANYRLEQLDAQIHWQRRERGWRLDIDRLQLVRGGSAWRSGGLSVALCEAIEDRATAIDTAADGANSEPGSDAETAPDDGGDPIIAAAGQFLRLQDLLDPLALLQAAAADDAAENGDARSGADAATALLEHIARLRPRGDLVGWSLHYRPAERATEQATEQIAEQATEKPGETDRPRAAELHARGTFAALGLRADGAIPGFSGLDGSFNFDGRRGDLRLAARDARFNAPRLFRAPLQIERLAGALQLALHDDGWRLSTDQLQLDSADLKSVSRLALSKHGDAPLQIDLQSDFRDGVAANAGRYYPVGIMAEPLVAWLDRSIISGRVSSGRLLLRGSSADFPYRDGHSGVFEVDFDAEDVHLDYRPGWPAITELAAKVRFHGQSMTIRSRSGTLQGGELSGVVASIPDLRAAQLTVAGGVHAWLGDLLDFAAEGPLRSRLSAFFAGASGEGRARLSLHTTIPLKGSDPERVRGALYFTGNRLDQPRFGLSLSDVGGEVRFTGSGIEIDQLQADYDGRRVLIAASRQQRADGSPVTRIEVAGPADPAQVLRRYGVPHAERFSGVSDWRLRLDLSAPRNGQLGAVDLRAQSELRGIGIDLPAPLGKPAETARAFELTLRVAGHSALQDFHLDYADAASGSLRLDERGALRRLDLRFGAARGAAARSDGIHLSGVLPAVSLDQWRALLDEPGDAAPGAAASTTADDAAPLPLRIDLRSPRLDVAGRSLHNLRLRIDGDARSRRGRIDSDAVSGRFDWPLQRGAERQLVMVLDELDLGALLGGEDAAQDQAGDAINRAEAIAQLGADGALGEAAMDPRQLPPLRIDVRQLRWGDYAIRDLRLRSEPTRDGLRLHELGFDNGALRVTGSGGWTLRPHGHYSELKLDFGASDLGTGLSRLGLAEAIDSGRAEGSATLSWFGPLYDPDLPSLTGDARFLLREGRLLAVDPGVGRIFGLFALQALPRRLTLDFRDLLRGGLDFDRIDARLSLANGVADTRLLRLIGPVGLVDITGQSDYLRRRLQQKIVVLPHIGSSLPILGLLTGGIATGLTVLVTDGLLRGLGVNLDEIGRIEYRLSGDWDDPLIEEIRRRNAPINSPNQR